MSDEEDRVSGGWHALITDVLGRPGSASWLAALDRPLSPGVVARCEAMWAAATLGEAGPSSSNLG
jgi:hypothetical protein